MFLQADLEDQVVMLKGKRTKRPRPPSSLELTTMAPTTSSSSTAAAAGGGVTSDEVSDRTTPSLSDSGELTHDEEQDMANCLILLAKGQRQRMPLPPPPPPPAAAAMDVYQCKTCDKSFSSFQALGGHRASHKKPSSKPITITAVDEYYQRSIQISDNNNNNNNNSNIYLGNQTRPKSTATTRRVHECSLCGAEFASGQALGGHMRRHRPIPAASISGSGHGDQHPEVKRQRNMLLSLDLNLPAAPEEEQPAAAVAAESKFPFAPKEQVIVFSATPLVDCHY
ncbi:hypothetical protein ABFS82_10G043500 [Erythranthe guttata]